MDILAVPFHEPVAIFAVVLLIVFLAPLLSEKFKIPSIVGLILAGVLFGPYGLGVLERDKAIELLGTIGLLYIMFLSGLEIELEQFKKNRKNSLLFGLLTFSIPLVMGMAGGVTLLGLKPVPALLLASMFSSHTLLTFPIVSRLGLSKRASVVTTVGGTIITDVLALLILAVVTGGESEHGGDLFWIRLIVLSILFVVLMLFAVPFVGQLFFRNINSDGITEYVFVMAILFISAVFSQAAGLEPIIGAFLAGLTLNRFIPEKSILMNRIQFVGNALFIPFFLISVGMLVNPFLIIKGKEVLIVAAVMSGIALLSKFLAARTTARILRFSRFDERLLFGMSVNQAAATLAAVLVGYRIGLFNDSIITGTIVMILVTCMVGAWSTGSAAQDIIINEEKRENEEGEAPQRILIPISNAATSPELLNLSFLIRKKNSKEPIYPINVIDSNDEVEAQIAKGEKLLAPAVVHAISAGVPVVPMTRADINVVTGINKAATDLRISEIIIGWHTKTPVYTAVTGALTDRIVKQTRQMLLSARLVRSLNITGRIIVLLPALVEKHPGFEKMVVVLATLAVQLSSKVLLIATGRSAGAVDEILRAKKLSMHSEFQEVNDWKSAFSILKKQVVTNDLVLYGAMRTGEIGWHPALERLPKRIMAEIPDTNVIIVYPGSRNPVGVTVDKNAPLPEILRGIHDEYTDFMITEKDIRQAIRQMFARVYPADKADALAGEINRVSYEEPVELCEGVILLHAHVEIQEYSIFIGVNRDGFDMPSVSGDPFAFFVLLAPVDQSPEKHLAILGAIAKLVQAGEFGPRLKNARSFEDFKKLHMHG